MIPKVRNWSVRVWTEDNQLEEEFFLETINAKMAKLCVRMDYPRTWGKRLTAVPMKKG